LSVSDTGEGMSGTTLAKAMEPFFTTKGIGKGTGLGLSMVHGLTAQCGGTINITSQLGRGTTVNLWLPAASAEDLILAPQPQTAAVASNEGRKLRILLVDDDFLVRTNTAFMLSDLGRRSTIGEGSFRYAAGRQRPRSCGYGLSDARDERSGSSERD
jgi:hypothetical protein